MVTITYAFGNYTGVLIVEDWTVALDLVAEWSGLSDMSWIRVQYSHIARDYYKALQASK